MHAMSFLFRTLLIPLGVLSLAGCGGGGSGGDDSAPGDSTPGPGGNPGVNPALTGLTGVWERNFTIVDGGYVAPSPTLIIRDEIGGTHLAAYALVGAPQAVTITPNGWDFHLTAGNGIKLTFRTTAQSATTASGRLEAIDPANPTWVNPATPYTSTRSFGPLPTNHLQGAYNIPRDDNDLVLSANGGGYTATYGTYVARPVAISAERVVTIRLDDHRRLVLIHQDQNGQTIQGLTGFLVEGTGPSAVVTSFSAGRRSPSGTG